MIKKFKLNEIGKVLKRFRKKRGIYVKQVDSFLICGNFSVANTKNIAVNKKEKESLNGDISSIGKEGIEIEKICTLI